MLKYRLTIVNIFLQNTTRHNDRQLLSVVKSLYCVADEELLCCVSR